MASRPRLAHLVPKRFAAPVRAEREETDEELGKRLKRRLLTLSEEAAKVAEASGDPAKIAAAQRGIEVALRVNGMLDVAAMVERPVVNIIGFDENEEDEDAAEIPTH